MARAPYKRVHKHGKGRGNELTVICSYCGKKVPKYKTFTQIRSVNVLDAGMRKEMPRNSIMIPSSKLHVCLSCARHRKISEPLKSRKSKRKV